MVEISSRFTRRLTGALLCHPKYDHSRKDHLSWSCIYLLDGAIHEQECIPPRRDGKLTEKHGDQVLGKVRSGE